MLKHKRSVLIIILASLLLLVYPAHAQGPVVYLPSVTVARPSPMRCAGDTYNRADIRQAAGVQCWYNWGPVPGGTGIPMVYGASSVGQALSGDPLYVMVLNEPDRPDQANVTPEAAVALWVKAEQSYPNRRLVSPGVMDLNWLIRFRALYLAWEGHAPRMDVLAVHWYYWGQGEPLDMFERQVLDAVALATEWQVPQVWVTEFALYPCWLGQQATVEFVGQAYDWLEGQPLVTRAFWFQVLMCLVDPEGACEPWSAGPQCNSSLGRLDGRLTPYGEAFRDSAARTLVGDVTGDGCVDIFDLAVVGGQFGECR